MNFAYIITQEISTGLRKRHIYTQLPALQSQIDVKAICLLTFLHAFSAHDCKPVGAVLQVKGGENKTIPEQTVQRQGEAEQKPFDAQD